MATDDFNRAGPGLGANWDEAGESGNGIANDQMAVVAANALDLKAAVGASALMWGFVRWAADLGGDHSSSLKIKAVSAFNVRMGPMVRCQGTGNSASLYAALYTPNEGPAVIRLTKYVAQTLELDGTLLGSFTVTLAVDDVVKIEAVGAAIKVFVNGIERISATDAAVTGGRPGAGIRGNGGQQGVGCFTTWDDWEGLAAAAGAGGGSPRAHRIGIGINL